MTLTDDAADIGLTRKRIQTLAESRLRAARLYNASIFELAEDETYAELLERLDELFCGRTSTSTLPCQTMRSHTTFHFRRLCTTLYRVLNFLADTWKRGGAGTHGGDAGFIMQSLSEKIDEFVLEYLRVNEEACDAGSLWSAHWPWLVVYSPRASRRGRSPSRCTASTTATRSRRRRCGRGRGSPS